MSLEASFIGGVGETGEVLEQWKAVLAAFSWHRVSRAKTRALLADTSNIKQPAPHKGMSRDLQRDRTLRRHTQACLSGRET